MWMNFLKGLGWFTLFHFFLGLLYNKVLLLLFQVRNTHHWLFFHLGAVGLGAKDSINELRFPTQAL